MIEVTEKRDSTHCHVLWIPESRIGWAISRFGRSVYLSHSIMYISRSDDWAEEDVIHQVVVRSVWFSAFSELKTEPDQRYPGLSLADEIMLERMWPVFTALDSGPPRPYTVRKVTP